MCGIALQFAYGSRAPLPDGAALDRMSHRLRVRGPDGVGTWASADGRAALAHRRLAILDLSERGAQPMRSADGSCVITFNGEIYNFRVLRAELEARGRRFATECDTEVLLHLWAEKGEAMVHDLRGMFAFAIWDERHQGLFLARDAFGIKPLYVADDGQTLRAASEVKALLAAGGVDTRPEPAGHVGFFLWGHVPEPYTLYRGIRALPAGSTMWVARDTAPVVRPYASVTSMLASAESEATTSDLPVEEQLREALLDSMEHHLVADVDVGVFLSAGLDSTTLAAFANEAGARLRTVTLGFEEFRGTPNDETPLAELAARHYGAQHTTHWITRDDFRRQFNLLLERMDQPTTDGVNTFFVARAAAQSGLKVALSGLGGDELFAGYPSFRQVPRIARTLGKVPAAARLGRGFRAVSVPLLKRFTSPKYAGLLEYGSSYGGAYLLRRGMFLPFELPAIMDPELVREGWRELETLARLEGTLGGIANGHLRVSALEATWYMRNQLLRDTDWASMTHALEVRVPLVDWTLWRRVAPLLRAMPVAGKRMMALTAQPPLPSAILDRAKTGFVIPTRDWMQQEQHGFDAERGLRGWARYVYAAAA